MLPWEIAPQLLQFPRCRASARARCREGATPRRRQHDCTRHLGLLLCGYRGCWRCRPADHAAWRAPGRGQSARGEPEGCGKEMGTRKRALHDQQQFTLRTRSLSGGGAWSPSGGRARDPPPLRTCLGPSEIDLEWLKRWCTWRTRGARSARGSDLVGPALLDALRLRRVPAASRPPRAWRHNSVSHGAQQPRGPRAPPGQTRCPGGTPHLTRIVRRVRRHARGVEDAVLEGRK